MSARAFVVLAAVLAVAAPASAQQPDAPLYQTVVHARPKRDKQGTIVITARELQERGIDNLSQALDLVPQLAVRVGGRGPTMVDMRGQKQRAVMVLVDGAPMDEPYYGAFDLSSIPVTDIVEIRINLTPASPLEGPGGDGGMIEVITLRAVGGKRLDARLRIADLPDVQGAVSGRHWIVERWGLAARESAGGRYGSQDFLLTEPNGARGTIGDPQYQGHGALRLEHESRWTLSTVDGWMSQRSYWAPPSEDVPGSITHVASETSARLVAGSQYTKNRLRLAAGAYSQWISTRSEYFANGFSLLTPYDFEQLDANRTGAAVHFDHGLPRGFSISARASIDEESATVKRKVAKSTSGSSTYGELAVGAAWTGHTLRAEVAGGLAAPLGGTRPPWGEGKFVVQWSPNEWFGVRVTGARKGRQPTLRELYDPITGNPKLNSELSWFAELAMTARPHPLVNLRATGFYRWTDGLIRLDVETRSKSVNYDSIETYGMETGIDLATQKWLSAGGTYVFEEAQSPTLGLTPINNFARHKVDTWVAARFKRDAGGLVRVRWIAGRTDNGTLLPDYTLVDLNGWIRVHKTLRATLLVSNLTDQRYVMRQGVSSMGRVISLSLEGTWE